MATFTAHDADVYTEMAFSILTSKASNDNEKAEACEVAGNVQVS